MNQLAPIASAQLPAPVAASGERTGASWNFSPPPSVTPTRAELMRDVRGFLAWCTDAGIASMPHVTTIQVATYIEQFGKAHSAPTAKRHLAAIRHLFDYLATGGVGALLHVAPRLLPSPTGMEAKGRLSFINAGAGASSARPHAQRTLRTAMTLAGRRITIWAPTTVQAGPHELRPLPLSMPVTPSHAWRNSVAAYAPPSQDDEPSFPAPTVETGDVILH